MHLFTFLVILSNAFLSFIMLTMQKHFIFPKHLLFTTILSSFFSLKIQIYEQRLLQSERDRVNSERQSIRLQQQCQSLERERDVAAHEGNHYNPP